MKTLMMIKIQPKNPNPLKLLKNITKPNFLTLKHKILARVVHLQGVLGALYLYTNSIKCGHLAHLMGCARRKSLWHRGILSLSEGAQMCT